MNRRNFIAAIGTATTIAIAGCSTETETPPPRKSNVIENVEINNGEIVVEQPGDNDQWVASRRDLDGAPEVDPGGILAALSPIGTVEAKGRGGRGSTARGGKSGKGFKSAPKTRRGRGRYGGGTYVGVWYDDHEDEVEAYPVEVQELSVVYIGTDEEFTEMNPGPGAFNNWDETVRNPDQTTTISVGDLEPGWYRVGANVALDADGSGLEGTDFGWEAIDIRVEDTGSGPEITKRWKVSPRI